MLIKMYFVKVLTLHDEGGAGEHFQSISGMILLTLGPPEHPCTDFFTS